MLQTTLRLIGIIATTMLLPASLIAPASADGNWKSLRNDDGERIRWHSCTVEYAVDMNGYPPSRRKALNEAIRSTEAASGLDFKRVSWSRADLKISLLHQSRGKTVGTTQSWTSGDENTRSKIKIYAPAFSYGYVDQVDNYRHEIGHSLGLNHVQGSDIMNAFVRPHPTRSGWRAGLRWLYRGC